MRRVESPQHAPKAVPFFAGRAARAGFQHLFDPLV